MRCRQGRQSRLRAAELGGEEVRDPRVFEELRGASDPFEHYQKMMVRNAKRTDGSGLGLARIRAEAEMDLDCEIENDRVVILARTGVNLRTAT